jgi:hypothetical protein
MHTHNEFVCEVCGRVKTTLIETESGFMCEAHLSRKARKRLADLFVPESCGFSREAS